MKEYSIDVGDLRIAITERGERTGGRPTALFVHATGFHGRVWDQVISHLPGDLHSICIDQRGHGRSTGGPIDDWRQCSEVVVTVIETLGLAGCLGIGHSMGGHALLDASGLCEGPARLLLLDPTVVPPEEYAPDVAAAYPLRFADGHPMARRRSRFDSPAAMAERLATRGSYGLWDSQALLDYCTHGLEATGDGDFELACRPEVEASIYVSARSNGAILDSMARVRIPVTVVRAKSAPPDRDPTDFSFSPTWPGLVGALHDGRDIHWPDCTHFIPMERPADVAALIGEELEQL